MSTLPVPDTRSAPEAAFAEMYERNADRIYAFCRRRLRSREEAEDAVQETFVAAIRAIKRGSVPLCESAWLFKIAENVCFAAYRSGARRQARDLSDSERIDRLAARDRDGDTLIGLEAALDTLPSKQRDALVLRELRGLSYKEIAIQLGVSVPSVETLIYRARRGLVRELENGAGLGRRMTAGLNLGSALSVVKGWFAGSAAVKVASAASVAALATLAAGDVRQEQGAQPQRAAQSPAAKQSVLDGTQRGSAEGPTPSARPLRRDPGPRRPHTRPKPASPATLKRAKRPPSAGSPATTEAPPTPAVPVDSQEAPAAAPAAPSPPAPAAVPQPPPTTPAVPSVAEPPEIPNVVGDVPPLQVPGVQLPGAQLPPVQVPPVQVPDLPILP